MHPLRFATRAPRLVAALAVAFAWSAQAAPSTEFLLGGAVDTPAIYDRAALAALPSVTQIVTYQSGSSGQTHRFVGTPLWGLLDKAGIQTDPNIKNDALNRIVVTQGSDGYRSVFALGELNPNFGNLPALAAYDEVLDGANVPLGSDGFARSTAPGDVKGGRYVSNLTQVQLQHTASTVAGIGGGASTSFSVSGDVLHPMTFDLAGLQALPSVTHTVGDETFTGVSLWSLLNDVVGIATNPAVKNDILGMYVVATGSDGYKSAFSLGELSPSFGNEPDLVAYELDGSVLTTSGFARVVVPEDDRRGRWASNLISLEVFHAAAVPEPQTYALFALGLLALGWRVRRA